MSRFGSITQSSTVRLGCDINDEDVYVPMNSLLPMVRPDDIVLDGWDISNLNMYEAMQRAKVLEPELQNQLRKSMIDMKPRPSAFDKDFIAENQVNIEKKII